MKSILLSIRPEWLVKILNGEKTIEVRKKFPKDYVGWVYLYCSKRNELVYFGYGCGNVESLHTRKQKELMQEWKLGNWNDIQWFLDKKEKARVVARFWCDKVENVGRYNVFEYGTETITPDNFNRMTCLRDEQIREYLGNSKKLFAIHISKLEIFDKPRELGEFNRYHEPSEHSACWKCKRFGTGCVSCSLTKAPQNYCYVEVE